MKLFHLGDAFRDIKSSNGALDTGLSITALIGKVVINTGMIILDEIPKKVNTAAIITLESATSTEEQKEKAKDLKERSGLMIEKKLERSLDEARDELSVAEDTMHENIGSNKEEYEKAFNIAYKKRKEIEKIEHELQSIKY